MGVGVAVGAAVGVTVGAGRAVAVVTGSPDSAGLDMVGVGTTSSGVGRTGGNVRTSVTSSAGTAILGVVVSAVGDVSVANELHAANRATDANTEAQSGRLARLN